MVVRASAVAVLLVAGLGVGSAHAAGGVHSLEVLSNRADLISGGDALVAASVTGPVTVDLDGTDVTSAFAVRPSGRLEGLVTGLKVGPNALTVRDATGAGKRITITNHPIGGPIFAGPQVTPYACNPNASTPPLGETIDAQCNAKTVVDYLYRNAADQFAAYDPANPPADVQSTRTESGATVPFIVQRVTGTVDRGIYQAAVLVDPSKAINPWTTEQPWARKLVYVFGGACGTQHQQLAPANILQAGPLGTGFVVASSSLNVYANNCNDVVSAEAAMMTKELVVERYGPLKYTIGNGGSAATMQQHLLTENYPGLLDGLTTSQAFEDHFTQVQGSLDCRVLMHYFWPTSPLSQPGHATAPPNALFPTAAARQPVWGSNPTNPDNLCGQKVLAFGADRTELVPTANVACGLAARAALASGQQPDRRALRHRRLHALDLRRHRHARRAERQGQARRGQRRRAVRPRRTPARAAHAGAVRRPQPQGRRHRHRRELHPAADGGRPGRGADRLRDRADQQRDGRREDPRDRQPDRRPDGRHGLPSRLPLVHLPRAPRQGQRQPRQPGDLALAHRRPRAQPVRRHAPVARHGRQAHARRLLHGRRRAGRPFLQRHLDVLRQPAPRGRGAATRSTSSSASSSRSRAATTSA